MNNLLCRTLFVNVFAITITLITSLNLANANSSYPRVQPLLSTSQSIISEKLIYPIGDAKVSAVIVNLQPGEETGWHQHGVPLFGYILQGELTVDYGIHGKRIYREGDSLVEAITAAHNGVNTGSNMMRVLAVFMGTETIANSVAYSEYVPPILQQLRKIIADRLDIMSDVSRYKWNNQIAIEDLEREAVIQQATSERAVSAGIPDRLALTAVTAQIQAAKMIQSRLYTIWQEQGIGTHESVLDLKKEIRPRIAKLTTAFIDQLALALPLLSNCSYHAALMIPDESHVEIINTWRAAISGIVNKSNCSE
ncbi:MAG: chorismate mutase-like protein [Parasphingorhabdus sp.]|jgi:chorismate mutase-like protein